jgi:hypothetical protein
MATPGGPQLPHPVLQAMLICDQAIRENGTHKVTLVGIFDQITSDAFPLVWNRPLAVYARITDAQGTYPIRLELVQLEDEQSIGRLEGQAVVNDRMAANELIFGIEGIQFDRPGTYEFRLFAGGRFVIGGALLRVVQLNQPQGGPHD